jgi:hypothetical protein
MINWKQKLQNPFVLGAQGFIVGMALFWATLPSESVAQDDAPQVSASTLKDARVGA